MESLKGKSVIITGASSGLGKALALRLAREGCNLILSARRLEKLKELDEEIKKMGLGGDSIVVKTDISREKEVVRLFEKAIEKFGRVDILINNAGRGLPAKIHEISKKDWDSVIHTNLDGVFLSSREAVKHMLKNKEGHIITVCSIAGLYGAPGFSAYCASKHAVAGLKRSLWLELRKKGIKISTIYPARINTEFFKDYKEKPSAKEMVSAEDIADYMVSIMKRQKVKRVLKRIRLMYKRLRNLI
jgi:3-oxoacyl-[acyl-carrier protein] reductase